MSPRSDYRDDLPAIERYRIVLGAFIPLLPDAHKIIQEVRAARGLCDPRDQDELAHNLRTVTPQALEPEAREALRRHRWSKQLRAFGTFGHPEGLRKWAWLPAIGPFLDITVRGLEQYGWSEKFFTPLARHLAHHIVLGHMDLPQPLPDEYLSTAFAFPVAGDKMVVAFAHAMSDPRQVAEELVRVWHETFPAHEPDQLPTSSPTLARNAWAWSTYETLSEEDVPDLDDRQMSTVESLAETMNESKQATSRYVTLAEMYCEAFPDDAQGEPDTPQRDQYLIQLVPTLRQARNRFRRRLRSELQRWPQVAKLIPPDDDANEETEE